MARFDEDGLRREAEEAGGVLLGVVASDILYGLIKFTRVSLSLWGGRMCMDCLYLLDDPAKESAIRYELSAVLESGEYVCTLGAPSIELHPPTYRQRSVQGTGVLSDDLELQKALIGDQPAFHYETLEDVLASHRFYDLFHSREDRTEELRRQYVLADRWANVMLALMGMGLVILLVYAFMAFSTR